MKRQNNLYSVLISDDNLKEALFEVNLTHRWHPQHNQIKLFYGLNLIYLLGLKN